LWWNFDGGTLHNSVGNNYYVTFPSAGNYNITQYVSGTYGSDSLLMSSYITIYENNIAAFTPSSDSVPLAFATVGFTNNSTGADIFDWSFGDGNLSTQQDPFHTYSSVGDYEVKLVAASAECPSDSTTHIIHVYQGAGIDEADKINVLLYPNPASDFVFLQNNEAETLDWQLFDASGRLICEGLLPKGEIKLDISELAKGWYSIQISSESEDNVFRLIKE
jgi:PKD repeat protein